jgi:hypothetical protein
MFPAASMPAAGMFPALSMPVMPGCPACGDDAHQQSRAWSLTVSKMCAPDYAGDDFETINAPTPAVAFEQFG